MKYIEIQEANLKEYLEGINNNTKKLKDYILLDVFPHNRDSDRMTLDFGSQMINIIISANKLNIVLKEIEYKYLLNTTILEKILYAISFNKAFDLVDLEEFYRLKFNLWRYEKLFKPLFSRITNNLTIPYQVEMFLLGFGWEKQAQISDFSMLYIDSMRIDKKFDMFADNYIGLKKSDIKQFRKEKLDAVEYYIKTGKYSHEN